LLSGVFSDEHGDYPAGTYIRNPPLSHHAPRTAPGCVIFVKLRQMRSDEKDRVVIDTSSAAWGKSELAGLATLPLYRGPDGESVALERLEPGAVQAEMDCSGGEEIFILSGDLHDGHGIHHTGTWIRNPRGFLRVLGSSNSATYWVKRGHLPP
jgi:anti-sigma factor ChrR (cupin superfamily)